MNGAALMGMLHGVADAGHQAQALAQVEAMIAREARQRPAVDQLHREIRLHSFAGVERARLVDLGDAGMLEPGQDFRLELEAADRAGIEQAGADHLERDQAMRAILLGLVHHAHAANAQAFQDPVVADHLRRGARRACCACRGSGRSKTPGTHDGGRQLGAATGSAATGFQFVVPLLPHGPPRRFPRRPQTSFYLDTT